MAYDVSKIRVQSSFGCCDEMVYTHINEHWSIGASTTLEFIYHQFYDYLLHNNIFKFGK